MAALSNTLWWLGLLMLFIPSAQATLVQLHSDVPSAVRPTTLRTLDKNSPRQFKSKDELNELTRNWGGIYWTTANETCTMEELDIIARAIEVAYDMVMAPVAELTEDDRYDSGAFNRFFFTGKNINYAIGWRDPKVANNKVIQGSYNFINGTISEVWKFLRYGHGSYVQREKRIKVTCKPLGRNSGCRPGVGAYVPPSIADNPPGSTIVFCPKFFTKKYIEDLARPAWQDVRDLEGLVSFEHQIIHELMHIQRANPTRPLYKIDDLIFRDERWKRCEETKVYGAECTYFFSRRNNYQMKGVFWPNPEIAFTAESYAWFYTNMYFANRYGWTDDGAGFPGSEIDFSKAPECAHRELKMAVSQAELEEQFGHNVRAAKDYTPDDFTLMDIESLPLLNTSSPASS